VERNRSGARGEAAEDEKKGTGFWKRERGIGGVQRLILDLFDDEHKWFDHLRLMKEGHRGKGWLHEERVSNELNLGGNP